jgi:IS5 family transposase
LYYSHHFRERELAEARKHSFETEAKEIEDMGVDNIRTAQQLAQYRNSRIEAAGKCSVRAKEHKHKENLYLSLWRWSGRIARLSFATGIGMLLCFAIRNS